MRFPAPALDTRTFHKLESDQGGVSPNIAISLSIEDCLIGTLSQANNSATSSKPESRVNRTIKCALNGDALKVKPVVDRLSGFAWRDDR